MQQLHIALVEPRIPSNTGNIARTCAACGAYLHLVYPMGFKIDDKKLKRAGLDYWSFMDIIHHKNLEEFITNINMPMYFFTTKSQNNYTDIEYPDKVCIVFGREDAGLPEELLYKNPHRCARIPMRNNIRSLNLANSVAIAAYEILRKWSFPKLCAHGKLTNFDWDK